MVWVMCCRRKSCWCVSNLFHLRLLAHFNVHTVALLVLIFEECVEQCWDIPQFRLWIEYASSFLNFCVWLLWICTLRRFSSVVSTAAFAGFCYPGAEAVCIFFVPARFAARASRCTGIELLVWCCCLSMCVVLVSVSSKSQGNFCVLLSLHSCCFVYRSVFCDVCALGGSCIIAQCAKHCDLAEWLELYLTFNQLCVRISNTRAWKATKANQEVCTVWIQ